MNVRMRKRNKKDDYKKGTKFKGKTMMSKKKAMMSKKKK